MTATDADALVREHVAMVRGAAKCYKMSYGAVGQEDLEQEGYMGLLEAARRYDPDRGVSFKSYASLWVHGRIRDYLRSQDPLNRRQRSAVARGEAVEPKRLPLKDVGREEQGYATVETRDDVAAVLRRLNPRDRRILELYYLGGQTMAQTGDAVGLSESRIAQIHKALMKRLHDRWSSRRD